MLPRFHFLFFSMPRIWQRAEFDKYIQYINLDFAVQYVWGIFSVIGIGKVKVLRVEGLDLAFNNKKDIVEKGIRELEEWIEEFTHRNK